MPENTTENDCKTKPKLFVKGGPGGPGRGKKKPHERLSLDEIEGLLQKDLRSSDHKVRHNATKLLLMLRKQSGDLDNAGPLIDPALEAAFSECFSGYSQDNNDDAESEYIGDDIE